MGKREQKEFEALRTLRDAIERFMLYRYDEGLPCEDEDIGGYTKVLLYDLLIREGLGETLFTHDQIKEFFKKAISRHKKYRDKELKVQFDLVGLDQKELHAALRKMGRDFLKIKKAKEKWTPEKPTTGYCYLVCQVIYHCLKANECKAYYIKTNDGNKHYFIKLNSGKRIDLTSDQFDFALDYDKERRARGRGWGDKITQWGKILAFHLGLEPKT